MTCKDCEAAKAKKHHGIYQFTCFHCRERFLLDEPCKLMREVYAKSMARWGETPNWKREPNCGCAHSCKRRQYMRDDATKQGKLGNAKR